MIVKKNFFIIYNSLEAKVKCGWFFSFIFFYYEIYFFFYIVRSYNQQPHLHFIRILLNFKKLFKDFFYVPSIHPSIYSHFLMFYIFFFYFMCWGHFFFLLKGKLFYSPLFRFFHLKKKSLKFKTIKNRWWCCWCWWRKVILVLLLHI